MSDIVCPACRGEKRIYRRCFPAYLSGWKDCETCGAAGSITDEKQTVLKIAELVKQRRRELRVLTRDVAAEFGCSIGEWSDVEQGRGSLRESEAALDFIARLAEQFVDKFDVYQSSAFGKREKLGTYNSIAGAEAARDELRMVSSALNIAVVIDIVPRKERKKEAQC